MQRRGILVEEMAWPEVMAQLGHGAVALLPVGAACKQHGLHLPMNSDYLQARYLSTEIVARAHVVVWPVLAYGYYPAFVDYPGSCSLSYATFSATVSEIITAIQCAGAHRIRILNTGLSTIEPLQNAIRQAAHGKDTRLVNIYAGPRYLAVAADLEQQRHGGHADELETSILLAIDPDRVDMTKAANCDAHSIQGVFNRSDPHKPNYSPSGVYGDATLASAEKGSRLLHAMIQDVLEAL